MSNNRFGGKGGLLRKPIRKDQKLMVIKKPVEDKFGNLLPQDIQFMIITKFLNGKDIATKMIALNRKWYSKCSSTMVWTWIDRNMPLELNERLIKLKCLVERRSKGALIITRDRITQQKHTLRLVSLDVTNAGQDDGLPASILREVSILKTMQHQHISSIKQIQVRKQKVSILYDYHDYNLKDYVRRFSEPFLPNSQYLRQVRNDKPTNVLSVQKIKKIVHQIV